MRPPDVEDAFIKVNPGLTTSGIAVTCNRKRLSEVRICLSKDLQFRDCAEIDRRACRCDQVDHAAGAGRLTVIASPSPRCVPMKAQQSMRCRDGLLSLRSQ